MNETYQEAFSKLEDNDGIVAYSVHGDATASGIPGMTMRDYFAGQALAGWLGSWPSDQDSETMRVDGVSKLAYEVADAMLRERDK